MANLHVKNSPISLQFLNEFAGNFICGCTRQAVITLCKFNDFVYFLLTTKRFGDNVKIAPTYLIGPSITCPINVHDCKEKWTIAFKNFEDWNLMVEDGNHSVHSVTTISRVHLHTKFQAISFRNRNDIGEFLICKFAVNNH